MGCGKFGCARGTRDLRIRSNLHLDLSRVFSAPWPKLAGAKLIRMIYCWKTIQPETGNNCEYAGIAGIARIARTVPIGSILEYIYKPTNFLTRSAHYYFLIILGKNVCLLT